MPQRARSEPVASPACVREGERAELRGRPATYDHPPRRARSGLAAIRALPAFTFPHEGGALADNSRQTPRRKSSVVVMGWILRGANAVGLSTLRATTRGPGPRRPSTAKHSSRK